MKSSKISSDKYKTCTKPSTTLSSKTKISQSSPSAEGLNFKNKNKTSVKETECKSTNLSNKNTIENYQTIDRDIAELASNEEFGTAFEKFWKSVTDGIGRQTYDTIPRSTQIDNKISEIQERINLNQAILKTTHERVKGITFNTERQNFSNWEEGLEFRNPSRDDLSKFADVKALDLEIQKFRERKPDRNVFLKSSPGIVNFHETMENTLNMLDKMQKSDELNDWNAMCRDMKNEFHLDFIKEPNLVIVSDEE